MTHDTQNLRRPFHGSSPFGLWPGFMWLTWAVPRLPDRSDTGGNRSVAPARSGPGTAEIIDLEEYRQRRLGKFNGAPARNSPRLRHDR